MVDKQLQGHVVAFDPETFEVGYHAITGWYEGPPDRIFEVELASGRRVRVTAGHNLFTLDRDGQLAKVRTGALRKGLASPYLAGSQIQDLRTTRSTSWRWFPNPNTRSSCAKARPSQRRSRQRRDDVYTSLRSAGYRHTDYYRAHDRLPVHIARELGLGLVARRSRFAEIPRCTRPALPVRLSVDTELAWLLGMYVAEGYRRADQFVVSNTDQTRLDRVEAVLRHLGPSRVPSAGRHHLLFEAGFRIAWLVGYRRKGADEASAVAVSSDGRNH